ENSAFRERAVEDHAFLDRDLDQPTEAEERVVHHRVAVALSGAGADPHATMPDDGAFGELFSQFEDRVECAALHRITFERPPLLMLTQAFEVCRVSNG